MKCLGTRALRICDKKDIKEETTRLKNVFQAIGYPTYKIQSLLTIRGRTIHRRDLGEDDRKTLVLPYIPSLSENISSSCTVPDKNNLHVTRESCKFQCVFSRNRIYGSTRKFPVLMFYHSTCNKISRVIYTS